MLSVIVVSRNEGSLLRRTVSSLLAHLPDDAEIVVIDDCSTDNSLPLVPRDDERVVLHTAPRRLGTVQARNYGASLSRGDTLVFSDAHIEVPERWTDRLLAPLEEHDVGAVGPTITMMRRRDAKGYGLRFSDTALNFEWGPWQGAESHPVPILGAGFMAIRREVFDRLGGFDGGMVTYGMEDPDLCFRLWTYGYSCLVVPTVEVAHVFRNDHPFQDWHLYLHNVLRFGVVHFSERRLARLIESHTHDPTLSMALSRVLTSDAPARRAAVHNARIRTDDWYFRTINV